jgi:hypothetical protein
MMSYWMSWPHEEEASISTGLRWAGEDEAVGYVVHPDDGHEHDDEDDEFEVQPFVEFEE